MQTVLQFAFDMSAAWGQVLRIGSCISLNKRSAPEFELCRRASLKSVDLSGL